MRMTCTVTLVVAAVGLLVGAVGADAAIRRVSPAMGPIAGTSSVFAYQPDPTTVRLVTATGSTRHNLDAECNVADAFGPAVLVACGPDPVFHTFWHSSVLRPHAPSYPVKTDSPRQEVIEIGRFWFGGLDCQYEHCFPIAVNRRSGELVRGAVDLDRRRPHEPPSERLPHLTGTFWKAGPGKRNDLGLRLRDGTSRRLSGCPHACENAVLGDHVVAWSEGRTLFAYQWRSRRLTHATLPRHRGLFETAIALHDVWVRAWRRAHPRGGTLYRLHLPHLQG